MTTKTTLLESLVRSIRERKDVIVSKREDDAATDEGAMFIIVIVIMLTMFLLVTAVLMWTMNSVQTTSLQTSSYGAVTAAESGRDTALSNIANNECIASTGGNLGETSRYEVSIYRFAESTGLDVPRDINDAGVEPGCPTGSTTHVLIETVGYGTNTASGGESSQAIVSTYGYDSNAGFNEGQAISNSLTTADDIVLSFDVNAGSGYVDPLAVTDGSFACDSSEQNVEVNGSVHVFDTSSVSDFRDCEIITGDFVTAGNLVTGGEESLGGTGGEVIIQGDLCVEGTAPATIGDTVAGDVQYGQGPGSCSEHLEGADSWVDYSPNVTGLNVVNADAQGVCENTVNVNPKGETGLLMESFTSGENVIDFTDCNDNMVMESDNADSPIQLSLQSDVTLLFGDSGYSFSNVEVDSADAFAHDFNIITPDNTTAGEDETPRPHCENNTEKVLNNFSMTNTVSGLVYTPCELELDGENVLNGQLAAGSLDSAGSTGSLNYTPLMLHDNEHDDTIPSDEPGFITNYTPLSHIER